MMTKFAALIVLGLSLMSFIEWLSPPPEHPAAAVSMAE